MSNKKNADITARVIKDAAIDRRNAKNRVDEVAQDLQELQDASNQDYKPLVEAVQEAEAELRAHERYEDHLPRQEYDEGRRPLQAALDEAEAARKAFVDEAKGKAEPLQARLKEAAEAYNDLEVEWRVHERTAKVAGIDVAELLEEEE